ncbi:MAG: [NiFe]-hydrogenase assembly chaperone HybE [Bacteroidota bacterium]
MNDPHSSSAAIAPVAFHAENPAPLLEAHYQALGEADGFDHAECNAALRVEVIGFGRCAGDWLGIVVTPWFVRLLLLPGGGQLWGEIPLGQRRYLELPGGTLPFVADTIDQLGQYQYSTLVAPLSLVPDMAAARRIAADTLQAFVGTAPSPAPGEPPEEPKAPVSRRGFFRRLVGKQ